MIVARFPERPVLVDRTDRTWRLAEPLRYDSPIFGGRLLIPAGLVTDLASVPRLPFTFLFFGDVTRAPAIVHDFLYGVHLRDRETADLIFHEAMLADGVTPWKAWSMWKAVRVGGGRAYASGPRRYMVLGND